MWYFRGYSQVGLTTFTDTANTIQLLSLYRKRLYRSRGRTKLSHVKAKSARADEVKESDDMHLLAQFTCLKRDNSCSEQQYLLRIWHKTKHGAIFLISIFICILRVCKLSEGAILNHWAMIEEHHSKYNIGLGPLFIPKFFLIVSGGLKLHCKTHLSHRSTEN